MCAEIQQRAEEPHAFQRPAIGSSGYAVQDSPVELQNSGNTVLPSEKVSFSRKV